MTDISFAFNRAYSDLGISGCIKLQPEDFIVEEVLGFEPDGEGEHLFLYVEKKNLTTPDVITALSKLIKVHAKHIGYSGLKDKYAVTRQWLSVPWPIKAPMPELASDQFDVKRLARHGKKLKRGTHKANQFTLVVRELSQESALLVERIALIKKQGFPNYFGAQRFGFEGQNIGRALSFIEKPYKISRTKKSLYLSALRSYWFNHYLSSRIQDNNWNKGLEGDLFNLEGSNSLFAPDYIDSDINERVDRLDIHPVGPLLSEKSSRLSAKALHYEQVVRAEFNDWFGHLAPQKLETHYRPLRVKPDKLTITALSKDTLRLSFQLPSGSFATSLLLELIHVNEALW